MENSINPNSDKSFLALNTKKAFLCYPVRFGAYNCIKTEHIIQ